MEWATCGSDIIYGGAYDYCAAPSVPGAKELLTYPAAAGEGSETSTGNANRPALVVTLGINVCYWKEKVPGAYGVTHKFPCFIVINVNGSKHSVYGLPSNEYPGLIKICCHSGNSVDPDVRDVPLQSPTLHDIQLLRDFVRTYFPGLEPEPAIVERCMYTNTPDENFILDRHPHFKNIVLGAGFSGHGFKLSPVVGKLLCELSMGKEPSYSMEPFRVARFPNKLQASL